MTGLFGGKEPAPITQTPLPPTRSDAEIQQAALDVRRRRASATGRAETIKTSGQGVTDEFTSPVKTLLGEA